MISGCLSETNFWGFFCFVFLKAKQLPAGGLVLRKREFLVPTFIK